MSSDELNRIRLLQSRMRKVNKLDVYCNNDQSLKSIKSTDSKKKFPISYNESPERVQRLQQQENIESKNKLESFSFEEQSGNKKLTDYFKCDSKKYIPKTNGKIENQTINNLNKSTKQSVNTDLQKTTQIDSFKEQNKNLKQLLKVKDEMLVNFRQKMVQSVIQIHKMKRKELRLRVSTNKIRLGEHYSDKKGKQVWIDGTDIGQIKQKIQCITKQKEQLEKSKKSAKKSNKEFIQDPQEWKNSIACHSYFLSREEAHCQEILKKLEEQKALHIKEYKLLYQEEHSRYGKVDLQSGLPKWQKIKKYQLLELLGKGGFSEVYKAFDVEDLRQVAFKVHEFHANWNTKAKENYVKHALRENSVHKMLFHPNIVKLYDTVQIDGNSFCTVLQFCDGPDLSYYLKKHKRIPQKQAKMILKQVINAIKYLHDLPEKVIHYDLKPQNILFHKGKIKITDFGLCKTTKDEVIELTSQGVGTYWYLPPQCFEIDKKAVITPKVDIWSIGVIYFEMLYGQKPFGHQMSQMRILNQGIMLKACTVNFPNTQKTTVSNESKEFIKECLQYKVQDRVDIKVLSNHKLFQRR